MPGIKTGTKPHIVMADPEHYEVCYTINPWMRPDEWSRDPAAARDRARQEWNGLAQSLGRAGFAVDVVPAVPGLPDMVFPANAAIVLDGRALLARFRYAERRGEEAHFLDFFNGLRDQGLLTEVQQFPPDVFQEGAGDCIWDASRALFWAAHGPRSTPQSHDIIASFFNQQVLSLELVSEQFYHLDTCFCVLSGGEVMYYPQALSPHSQDVVARHVPPHMRIIATAEEAEAFSLNAINIGRDLIMSEPPPRLRAQLEERGYGCQGLPLSSFILSGGAAYCMTLRLDRKAEKP